LGLAKAAVIASGIDADQLRRTTKSKGVIVEAALLEDIPTADPQADAAQSGISISRKRRSIDAGFEIIPNRKLIARLWR